MRKTIEFTLARSRRELLSLKNKENIHIGHERFTLTDMLKVLNNNPRLQRVEITEGIYNLLLNKTISSVPNPAVLQLFELRGIELIVQNIKHWHKKSYNP